MAKLTPETKARLIEAIKLGMTNKLAAQYAGIAISTFYLWREKASAGDPLYMDLMDSLKRAEAQSAAHSLAVIKKAAQDGTWTAAAWMLERRHNFRKEAVHEPIQAVDTSELVDPTTAEGRAAIIAHVAELPDDIILAALNRGATE